MKVFFGVVLCILINSSLLATSAQEYSTTVPTTISTEEHQENDIATSETDKSCKNPKAPIYQEQNTTAHKTFAQTSWSISQTDENCIPQELNIICIALEDDNKYGWNWVIKDSSESINITGAKTATLTIKNLSEFTNYTCNGTLIMEDGQSVPTEIFKIRTETEVSTEPINLIEVEARSRINILYIEWEPPIKNPGEFISYLVHTFSYGPNYTLPDDCVPHVTDFWDETTKENITIYHLFSNYNYKISVFVKNSAGNGTEASIDVTMPTAASEQPREIILGEPVLHVESNVISKNISWKMPCESNGVISHFELILEGYYMLDDEYKDERKFIVNKTDNVLSTYSKQIDDILPASNYTISIRAHSENKTGFFYNETFVTEDNWPGVPSVENNTDIGSTFFVVSWNEPERKAGNITSYNIEIVSLMPLYDRDISRCPFQSKVFPEVLDGNIRIYNFTKAHPYYMYNVSIAATTSKGTGKSYSMFVETKSSVPEKPESLEFTFLKDNTSGLMSWLLPCNINGPLDVFDVTLSGTYTDDSSLHTDNYTKTIQFENGTYLYTHSVELLEAYIYDASIMLVLEDGTEGDADTKSLTTPDGYPGPPLVKNTLEVEGTSFVVTWEPPSEKKGKILQYNVNITSLGPLYETHCSINNKPFYHIGDGNTTMFKFTEGLPYYKYSIIITASTSRGLGNASEEFFVYTDQSIPEPVQNISSLILNPTEEEYNANATISFVEPCLINGPLKYYEIAIFGSRPNYVNTELIDHISMSPFTFNLTAEYNYSVFIKTFNERFNSTPSDLPSFLAPAGVPEFSKALTNLTIEKESSNAQVTLKKEYFDKRNGDIRYLSLILSENNITGEEYQSWDGENWPLPSINGVVYDQRTEDWWYPFEDKNEVSITLETETNCKESQLHCNKPLEKNKNYYLVIRIYTNDFYKDSPAIHFIIEDMSKLGIILGIIFGILGFSLLGIVAFFIWKRNVLKLPPFYPRKSSAKSSISANTAIPIYKFTQYCKGLENNPEKLTEQYTLLAEKTKEVVRMQTTMYAELTENRRKNRYTNILPYDETRVKLLIDEDDEIGSDYINASYIKGYSGKVEYIATQGPLPTTCRDFWKMVIQENVSIIVMVTQFIEQNKEKCYKYFPNNHESMIIEDMEVKCSMELHFGTYCVRTLQVKKDTAQATITHMQYLDWPDFNVPNGTENMLQFCYQLRERLKIEGGYVIIHCSAGVGRTGTLIATDILLQNVIAGKNIDVFNTILELRKQRTHMVQTQKQYMYIHNLIKDSLDQSHTSALNEHLEPVYENLSVIRTKQEDDNLIKNTQTESQF